MTLQAPNTTPTCKSAPWQILVVDAQSDHAQACAAILLDSGYSVATASSAAEATQRLRTQPVDLVLTDLAIPDSDGLQFLAHLREMFPDVAVAVMSESDGIEEALEAMQRGAADFLAKPFDSHDLRRVAASCLTSLSISRDKEFLTHSNAILELSRLLSAATDTQTLPVRALELACRDFQSDSAVLLAYDQAQNSLSALARVGSPLSRWGEAHELSAQAKEAMRLGKVVLAADPGNGDCYAYAPMKAGDRQRGVLCLCRARGPWFHEKSIELLEVFATHLAVSLETAHLYDMAARQVTDLEEVLTESRTVSLTMDREQLRNQMLTSAARVTAADVCAVMFLDEAGAPVHTLPPLPQESPALESLRQTMTGLANANASSLAPARLAPETRRQFACFVSAPIISNGAKAAVLAAFSSRPGHFSVEDSRRLASIAESAALSLAGASTLASVSVLYHETIELLANMADASTPDSSGHSPRVRAYASRLALAIGVHGTELLRIEDAALLHDIGHIRIAPTLVAKPGPLSKEESGIVALHAVIGAEMLAEAPHLRDMAPIVRYHHERFDGGGYPDGLRGEGIPLGARITAVADVFDALLSPRVFRPAHTLADARRILAEEAGAQFDPRLVDAFLALPLEQLVVR